MIDSLRGLGDSAYELDNDIVREKLAQQRKTNDRKWLLLLIGYVVIFSAAAYELGKKKGYKIGVESSNAPRVELKMVPVDPTKVEYSDEKIEISTGADKYIN
jgi:hypothetical protein